MQALAITDIEIATREPRRHLTPDLAFRSHFNVLCDYVTLEPCRRQGDRRLHRQLPVGSAVGDGPAEPVRPTNQVVRTSGATAVDGEGDVSVVVTRSHAPELRLDVGRGVGSPSEGATSRSMPGATSMRRRGAADRIARRVAVPSATSLQAVNHCRAVPTKSTSLQQFGNLGKSQSVRGRVVWHTFCMRSRRSRTTLCGR